MFGIARELEQIAVWFEPAVLILPGLAAVLLGLFVWLGGLGFKSALITIIGAVSGGICGFFLGGRNLLTVIISAVVAMVIAIIFERIFIIILAGVLAAGLAFAVLAGPYIESKGGAQSYPEPEIKSVKVYLGARESIEVMKEHIGDFTAETRRIFSRMPMYNWIIMAVLAAVLAAAGVFWQRMTSAFCCAALGVLLISTGMILLLLYKGAVPISRMCQSWLFYVGVFLLMTAFGMVGQMLLCPRIKERLTKRKSANDTEETLPNWRGR
jgi:hypothetical protein